MTAFLLAFVIAAVVSFVAVKRGYPTWLAVVLGLLGIIGLGIALAVPYRRSQQ